MEFIRNIFSWIARNKLSSLLIVLFLWYFGGNIFGVSMMRLVNSRNYAVTDTYSGPMMGVSSISGGFGAPVQSKGVYYPAPSQGSVELNVADRKVVTDSNLSLLVKSVSDEMKAIQTYVKRAGGFVVNSSKTTPDFGESGYLVVRVPNATLEDTLTFVRKLSVKVVSENIHGNDITDRFTDTEARLATLNKTKEIYENLMDKATDFNQILQAQQMILNVQDQIDSLKGQLKYMEATSASTLITINLSTDELSLPYTPVQSWRPEAIFKQAVRDLLQTLIGFANYGIWAIVYSVIWVPLLLVILLVRKIYLKRSAGPQIK